MNIKFKIPLSILTSAGMALSMMSGFPILTSAEEEVPYVVRSWNAETKTVETETAFCSDYTVLRSGTKKLSGWYVVKNSISTDDRLVVDGTANLILCDGVKLYCEDGICVSEGNTLNIYAQSEETGELYCDADTNDNAAIGANNESGDCGTVNIYGGKITADADKLGTDGAGIGGGDEGNGGIVRIYGGNVKAIGGKYGAGIGGGDADAVGGNGGEVYIYGGTVNAEGGKNAAGIGGGEEGRTGHIEIWGGDVTAKGSSAAGIGDGKNTEDALRQKSEISIHGGTVKANGGFEGAGIGGARNGALGTVNIDGGTITAVGGERGTGIGSGALAGNNDIVDEVDSGGEINISGGKITASGGNNGAGIGDGSNSRIFATVNISGGEITANGGAEAAGIGNGCTGKHAIVNISGGTVIANGGNRAAGIGCGSPEGTYSDYVNDGSIRISGGSITAKGGEYASGIGGGDRRDGGYIEITGGEIIAEGGENGAGIGGGLNGESGKIVISDGIITVNGGVNAAGIGSGKNRPGESITINGGKIKAEGGENGAGIGGGYKGDSGNITISGGEINAAGGKYAAGIGTGYKAYSDNKITVNGGNITAYGGESADGIGGGKDVEDNVKLPVILSYGENGASVYSNSFANADVKLEKPFTDGTEHFAAGDYADTAVLAGKNLVADDGMGIVRALALSLNGSIGIHFYMELSPELEGNENAYMEFTVPGGDKTDTQTMKFADTREEEVNGAHTHVFVCYVPAKEMTGQVSARLVNGDEKGIKYTFSVKEYGEIMLEEANNNEEYTKAAPLVKAMLNYGAAAQSYFDEAPAVLANDSLSDADKDISGVTAETIGKSSYDSDLPEGVKLHSATLSLRSETSLSLYFESEEELKFELAHDHEYEVQNIDGYQVVRIRNISANELSHDYTVTVTAGDKTGTVTYSPMNYCYEALNGGTDNAKLQNVARALYLYSKAADEYFREEENT